MTESRKTLFSVIGIRVRVTFERPLLAESRPSPRDGQKDR